MQVDVLCSIAHWHSFTLGFETKFAGVRRALVTFGEIERN